MRALLSVKLLLIASLVSAGCVQSLSASDLYQGQVVDEETRQPIVRAAVTVVWHKTLFVQQERSLYFQNAQETVTDAQGKFSLLVSPGVDWNPFTVVIQEPTIVIYQPGYEPVYLMWLVRMGFRSHAEFATALKNGFVVKLSKLKTEKEKMQFLDQSLLGLVNIPSGASPKLFAVINEHRKSMGYSPIK